LLEAFPGKSGLDILKELHGEDYPAPIFMISGQGDIAWRQRHHERSAGPFIEKPFRAPRSWLGSTKRSEPLRDRRRRAPLQYCVAAFPGRDR